MTDSLVRFSRRIAWAAFYEYGYRDRTHIAFYHADELGGECYFACNLLRCERWNTELAFLGGAETVPPMPYLSFTPRADTVQKVWVA